MKNFLIFFANFEEIVAGLFLTVLLTIVTGNVFLRFTTRISLAWLEEISTLCFAYLIFIGASAVFKRNLHSGVDLLVRLFPETIKNIVSLFSSLVLFATCIFVTYLSFMYAVGSGAKKTPILRIPYFYIDIAVTIGFGLMCLHCIVFLYNTLKYKDFLREKQLYKNIFCFNSQEDITQI